MINRIKKDLKLYITAFVIPLMAMISYLIEFCAICSTIDYDIETAHTFTELIGFYALFLILPSLFSVVLIIPKKFLYEKSRILFTLFLTFFFGWILVFLSYFISGVIYRHFFAY